MLFEIVTVSELRKTIKNLLRDSYSTEKERETNTEIERHDMLHLLAILAEAGSLDYPLTLVKRERPDFQLVMANRRIGIEHTRAVSENEAHKDSLRRKGYGPETFFISPVALGEPRKNKKQLIAEIDKNDPGDGWDGDSPEMEWANAMLYSINEKLQSIKKEGFERLDEDWLLIRDNWSLPAPDIQKASTFLLGATDLCLAFQEFKRIYVVTGQLICGVSIEGASLYRMDEQ